MDGPLSTVARRLSGLAARRPGLALALWGEAGVGKTHAARHLLREAPFRGVSLHAALPDPDLVRALPRPERLPTWAGRVLEKAGRGEAVESGSLAGALGALLAGLAPFALHLEDLHEAGPERFELARTLARAVAKTNGVALIMTSRAAPPEPFEALRLEPLSSGASRELLEAEVGSSWPVEAADWVFERARGNPLFSLEFSRYLARQGFLWNDGQRWRWREPPVGFVPVTVQALIERQLSEAASDPDARAALEARAVLGPGAPDGLWARVAGLALPELEAARAALERRGLFSGNEFAHPLFREVAASGLPSERRRDFARRALDALEDDPLEAVGFLPEAGLGPAETLERLERAARASRAAGNEVQAARLLAAAVPFESGQRRGRLALEAARGLAQHDSGEATRLAGEAARAWPTDPEAVYLLAALLARQERGDEAERVLASLPEPERSGERNLAARIECRATSGDHAGAVELWRAHPELAPTANPALVRRVASSIANLGDTTSALGLASRTLERPDLTVFDRMTLVELCGIARFYESDYAAAEELFASAARLAREGGFEGRAGAVLSNHGLALQKLGRFREAMADAEASARLAGDIGDGVGYMVSRTLLGEQLFELGQYDRAEEILLENRGLCERGQLTVYRIDIEGNLSDLYREWAPPHGGVLALKHGHAALAFARRLKNPRYLPEGLFYAATAEALYGNAGRALELAEEEQALAAGRGEARQVYKAAWARASALAALGRGPEALAALREAHAVAARVGNPLHAHKIGLEIDRLTGNTRSALERLGWFEERGLLNGANLARRLFPGLASTDPAPVAPRPGPALRLEVLGPMRFFSELDGPPAPVPGRKRQEFLALLVEARLAGRPEVQRLELLDALYPDTDELHATDALKDLVHRVRSGLAPSVVATTAGGYALGEAVSTDAQAFLESGEVGLWRGPYLDGLSLGRPDDRVREALHLALRSRAEGLLETDAPEAARVGRLLLEAEPYNLECLRLTLRAMRGSGNHRSLERAYARSRERFLEVGEPLPERWAAFLEEQTGATA